MRARPLVLLALLCLALLAGTGWLWVAPNGQLRPEAHWQEPAAMRVDYAAMLPALPGVSEPDTRKFVALLDRPLFSSTRRPPLPPPPPKPVEAPPPPDNLSTARLLAIFDVPGDGGSVILQIAGKNQRARVNGTVDGWTVQSINGRDVTFSRRGQVRTLQLRRAALTAYAGLGVPSVGSPAPPPTGSIPGAAAAAAAAAQRAAMRQGGGAVPSPSPPVRASFGGGGS